LARGADANQIKPQEGTFPLLIAAQDGHADCVEKLLARGADANQIHSQDGDFPLLMAAQNGHADCVEQLLARGAAANQVNPTNGEFPLRSAVHAKSARCTRALVESGAGVANLLVVGYPVLAAAIDGYRDEGIVLRAIQDDASALEFASHAMQSNKDVVLMAVAQNGDALQFASAALQDDPEVVRRAVQQDSGALRFAGEGLVQRKDLLEEAGLLWASWLVPPDSYMERPLVVMSVRFALHKEASPASTYLQTHLCQDPFFSKFQYYNPNAFNKGFCKMLADGKIDWDSATNKDWKCRGQLDGEMRCHLPMVCAGRNIECPMCRGTGTQCTRPCNQSCWRYSFAWHQQMARDSKGFMLQVIEGGKLGAGQEIEAEMAKHMNLETFKIAVSDTFNPLNTSDVSAKVSVEWLGEQIMARGY